MQTIKLDIAQKNNVPLLYVKQRDVGHNFAIELYENGKIYTVDENYTCAVWYSGESGEGNYTHIGEKVACEIEGNKITVEMIVQMLNEPGGHEMCVVVYDPYNKQKGFWNIPYYVEAIPGADSEGATDYYNAFLDAQRRAEEAAERAEDAAARAEAGAGGTIIVGIDEGEHATHTATEIYNAIQNNQSVVFRYDPRLDPSEFIPLTRSTPTLAVFSKTGYPTEFDIFDITIGAHGIVHYEASFSFELVKQAVEKVETDIAPVSYLPQDLTPEQQAQAQMNIGVDKLCPPFTESGSAVTCEPVEGYPLQVVSKIEPIQSGSGDPSPDNIRPISGHSAVKLTRSGKNLLNLAERVVSTDTELMNTAKRTLTGNQIFVGISPDNYLNPDKIESYMVRETSVMVSSIQSGYGVGFDIAVFPGHTYTFSVAEKSYKISYSFYDEAGTHISFSWGVKGSAVFTVPDNARWAMLIVVPNDEMGDTELTYTNLQFELGTTATAYEPYREPTVYTKGLGQDVGKGSLNWNTGVLTINWFYEELDGVEKKFYNKGSYGASGDYYRYAPTHYPTQRTIQGNMLCSHLRNHSDEGAGITYIYYANIICNINGFPNLDEANAWLVGQKQNGTPFQVCYELQEPITIQLTPQEIVALSGTNILSSNTGITEVTGRADPVAVINNLEDRLAALEMAVVNNA